MHPFEVSNSLQSYGFWFTYWHLRNPYACTRLQALWLIWVGHNYLKHRDEMLDNSVVTE